MARMSWDKTELDELALDLSKAPDRIQRRAPQVFARGAFEIKRGMKRDAGGHRFLPRLDQHVSYDRLGPLDYEIGFDKVGQGHLANFAAFGSVNNAPVLDHTAPLRHELPEIQRHLLDEGADSALGDSYER